MRKPKCSSKKSVSYSTSATSGAVVSEISSSRSPYDSATESILSMESWSESKLSVRVDGYLQFRCWVCRCGKGTAQSVKLIMVPWPTSLLVAVDADTRGGTCWRIEIVVSDRSSKSTCCGK